MSNSIRSPGNCKGQGKRPDVYQIVTDQVIERLESGDIPWSQPWRGGATGCPKNAISRQPYHGVNVFLLAMTANSVGYQTPYWLTYKQAKDLGGNVKKGEKSTIVVFWKQLDIKDKDNPDKTVQIPFLRYYNVFNVDQCENIDPAKLPDDATDDTPDLKFEPIDACENIVKHFIHRPEITHAEQRAYYSPRRDYVNMPRPEFFVNEQEYYSVLFHELTHSTGHENRLGRFDKDAKWAAFGSPDYSKEELVAEMGAAFLCGFCDIVNKTIENSAAYIQNWLKALRNDRKLVVQAAAQAQKSTDYIMGE